MRLVKNILISYLLLIPNLAFSNVNQKSILFFTQSKIISPAVTEFYAEVKSLLRNKYHIIQELGSKKIKKKLMVPFVDRSIFIKAHPYASLEKTQQTYSKTSDHRNPLIKPIQLVLENNALETAVLVDCHVKSFDLISSCGIYMYSRKKQKIIASSSRVFTLPVSTPKSWAPAMVENFIKGLKSVKEKKNQNIIQRLSIDEKINKEFVRQIWFEGYGLIGATSDSSQTMPGLSLSLELGSENIKFAMDGFYFHKEKKINNLSTIFRDYQLGLGVLLSSDKIRSLIWEMGFKVAYDYNQKQSKLEKVFSSNLLVSMLCGLKIPLGFSNAISFRASYGFPAVIKQADQKKESLNLAVVKYLSLGYVVQI